MASVEAVIANPPIVPTGITAVTNKIWSLAVIWQLLNSQLALTKHLNGVWDPTVPLLVNPIDDTPLASVSWNDEKEIRIYYLDQNYVIQEWGYTNGNWFQGGIKGVKANPRAGLSAVVWGKGIVGNDPGVHIRVDYQEPQSDNIKELAYDEGKGWYQGALNVPSAYAGTKLAAVTYFFQGQTQIRVYYQEKSLALKEFGWDGTKWFQGGFSPGQAPGGTPLGALAFANVEIQVYWRNLNGRVVYSRNTGAWHPPVVIPPIGPGYNFAVIQWENGKHIRIYYQLFDSSLTEYYTDDSGKNWGVGKFKP